MLGGGIILLAAVLAKITDRAEGSCFNNSSAGSERFSDATKGWASVLLSL